MPQEEKQPKETNPFSGRKYIRAVGRRKSAVAVAQLYARGKGDFVINKKPLNEYFPNFVMSNSVKSPLEQVDKKFDVNVRVSGGGPMGQAGAVRLAVARALVAFDEELKPALRKAGFVTVDDRVKERKKPGLKRARRAPQWSKR